jgi:hypothetical protein
LFLEDDAPVAGFAQARALQHKRNRLRLNGCSDFSSSSLRNVASQATFNTDRHEEDNMTTSGYVIAALAAIVVAAPAIAGADTVVIKHRDQHWRGAHAEFSEHRNAGWHSGWWHRDHGFDHDRFLHQKQRERYSRDRY